MSLRPFKRHRVRRALLTNVNRLFDVSPIRLLARRRARQGGSCLSSPDRRWFGGADETPIDTACVASWTQDSDPARSGRRRVLGRPRWPAVRTRSSFDGAHLNGLGTGDGRRIVRDNGAAASPVSDLGPAHPMSVAGAVVEARRRRARRPRSLRSTRPSSAAAARRAAKSSASSSSGPMMADSWPMSRRMVASVREAINGSVTPSIQTRVRRPSPRSSPVIRSRAKMRSARANFPKPRATMRESDATWPSWHYPPTPAPCCPAGQEGESLVSLRRGGTRVTSPRSGRTLMPSCAHSIPPDVGQRSRRK